MSHFWPQHRLVHNDTVNTVIMTITFVVSQGSQVFISWGDHVRLFSRQSRTSFLEVVMCVVSRDNNVRRISSRSCTSFLALITYVVSRGDYVRCLLRWSCTSSLEVVPYVVSRVEIATETWIRDAGETWHVTCDTWRLKCGTLWVGEHSLKISAP